jgi:hypothetical protein
MLRHDELRFERWKEEKAAYEKLLEEYESANKGARRGSSSSEITSSGTHGNGDPSVPTRPVPPTLVRNLVGDTTMEALVRIMEENPRGLLMVLDEAASLATSMNQYKGGKGSDRQFFLSTWSGQAHVVDRKGHQDEGPVRVPHPFLGIVGGMVPDMIGELCDGKGRHDGFVDRFLFTYPDPVPKTGWRDEGIPAETADAWAEILSRLLARPMDERDTQPVPHVVTFSERARLAWKDLIDAHHAEQRTPDFPDSLQGPWAKLDQYAGRLVLTLHLLHLAADPSGNLARLPDVPDWVVRAVERLLQYLKSHTRRVHAAMKARARGEEGDDDVQCVLKWILRHRQESFTVRDLTRDLSKTFRSRAQALEHALSWLVKHNCIRPRPASDREGGRPGRMKSTVYEVNPNLFAPQNCRNRLTDPAAAAGDPISDDFGDFATALSLEFEQGVADDTSPF